MIITKTPFRISFFGGGTDYPDYYHEHGGSVLSTTIDKYCCIACRYLPPFFEHKYRIVYSKIENKLNIKDIDHPAVRGVLEYIENFEGLEIHYFGDLPARSGLGSSSSFTVGLLNAVNALKNNTLSKESLAFGALDIEQNLLGEAVGSQDQVSAAYGGLNRIDFAGSRPAAIYPAASSRVLWRSVSGSCQTVMACRSTMQYSVSIPVCCISTKRLIAPR